MLGWVRRLVTRLLPEKYTVIHRHYHTPDREHVFVGARRRSDGGSLFFVVPAGEAEGLEEGTTIPHRTNPYWADLTSPLD